MNILEQEIENLVWDAIQDGDHEELADRGLPIMPSYTYVRQLNLGSYGIADLVGFSVDPSYAVGKHKYREIDIQVIELKKDAINADTFWQAIRYIKGLKEKFKHENLKYKLNFSIHLIGKYLDKQAEFRYLPDIFSTKINYYTYSIHLKEGVVFHDEYGYKLTQPSFAKNSNDLMPILKENSVYKLNDFREEMEAYNNQEEPDIIHNKQDDLPF